MPTPLDALRFPLAVDVGRSELAREADYDAHVRQLILQVLLTAPGERINRPDFGCGLRQMVFAANGVASANLVKVSVQQALDRWLGSVIEVHEVRAESHGDRLEVFVTYLLRARGERRVLNVEVTV